MDEFFWSKDLIRGVWSSNLARNERNIKALSTKLASFSPFDTHAKISIEFLKFLRGTYSPPFNFVSDLAELLAS